MDPAECDLVRAFLEGSLQHGNPMNTAWLVCGAVVVLTFAVSTINRNYSQVDKLWSIVPVIYAWIPVCDGRTLIMAILATIWGVRLTWNFHRRGGYSWPPWLGDEDYRWAAIQRGDFVKILTNPAVWSVFNLGFISLYQNVLLLAIVFPSYASYFSVHDCGVSSPLGKWDCLATASTLFFIVVESVADNQQYKFQEEKYRRKRAKEPLTGDYLDGFNQSGLFSIVRKPNYAAEQLIWVSYFSFSIGATHRWWNFSGTGFILLCQLFQVSGWFTEKLTRAKYPKYEGYMKVVPLYLPMPWLSSKDEKKRR